jgi:hypothetical protein
MTWALIGSVPQPPYFVSRNRNHLESRRALGPSRFEKVLKILTVRQLAKEIHSRNASHRDSQSDTVVVRRTGAFEILRAVPQVLRHLNLGPCAYLGAQITAGMSKPTGYRSA